MRLILTVRQKKVLQFIESFTQQNRRSPTLAEIGAALGFGASRAHALVLSLETARVIIRWRGHRTGIRMILKPDEAFPQESGNYTAPPTCIARERSA